MPTAGARKPSSMMQHPS